MFVLESYCIEVVEVISDTGIKNMEALNFPKQISQKKG
jgi:hypothetical protein